jgi:prepilin-type processing-associated H-X9-DG protein
MPVKFACRHCGAVTDVSEQYFGQSGACAECGQMITIPLSPGAYPGSTKRSRLPWILAIVGVAILGMLLVCGILVALLLPAVQTAREAERRAYCLNNLKQIGLATQSYHDANGHFPPAYTIDKDGQPLQSWRVLLLPFLEESGLYRQINIEEAWNSLDNRAVANNMPSIYRCPSDGGGNLSETSYVVVGGSGTAFEGSRSSSLKDLRDPSRTVLVIELPGSEIGWTEPRDLDVGTWDFRLASAERCNHLGVVNILFADGHVQSLDLSTDPQSLRQLFTSKR